MKKIFKILFITSLTIFTISLNSCSDEDKDSYGLSEVATFPVFTLTGGNLIVETSHSGSWTDPGVVAHAGEKELDVTSQGSVDPSRPGLYLLTYTAFDESGNFPVSTERKVLIVSAPLTADYRGSYQVISATRTNKMNVVSMGGETLGWYRASDSWWQSSAIPVEFVDLGTGLKVIPGNSGFGPFDGNVTYDAATNTFTFQLTFTSGVNEGVSWNTSWVKQ